MTTPGVDSVPLSPSDMAPLAPPSEVAPMAQPPDVAPMAPGDVAAAMAGTNPRLCLQMGVQWHDRARATNQEADFDQALALYGRAAALSPGTGLIWDNIGQLYADVQDHVAALAAFERALALGVADPDSTRRMMLLSHYCGAERPFAEMRGLARLWGASVAHAAAPLGVIPAPGLATRPLRLGVLGGSLAHSVAAPGVAVLRHVLAPHRLHLYSLSEVPAAEDPDSLETFITDLAGLTPRNQADRIAADRLDALLYIDYPAIVGMNKIFSYKPAATTGLLFHGFSGFSGLWLDFIIADAVLAPPDVEPWCDERVIRVPCVTLSSLDIFANRPPVAPPPRPRVGHAVYGCFNRPSKVGRRMSGMIAALLHHDPTGRFLLGSGRYDAPCERRRVEALLRDAGAPMDRIEIFGYSPGQAFLERYADVDVALDTPSFSGGLTSVDALLQGVPLVATQGDRPAGRISASLLTAMGLEALVADSDEAAIATAVSLAHDVALLTDMRFDLRRRFAASPVCDGASFVQALESQLRALLLEKYPEAA